MGLIWFGSTASSRTSSSHECPEGELRLGAAVQVFELAAGRNQLGEQPGQNHALSEVAGGAEQHRRLADGGRAHSRPLHLHSFDGTGADDVFEQVGEVGDVHAADAAARAREGRGRLKPVALRATGYRQPLFEYAELGAILMNRAGEGLGRQLSGESGSQPLCLLSKEFCRRSVTAA